MAAFFILKKLKKTLKKTILLLEITIKIINFYTLTHS